MLVQFIQYRFSYHGWRFKRFCPEARLSFLKFAACPHFEEQARETSFSKMVMDNDLVGIGIESCAALYIEDKTYSVFSSREKASVWKLYKSKGQLKKIDVFEAKKKTLEWLTVK